MVYCNYILNSKYFLKFKECLFYVLKKRLIVEKLLIFLLALILRPFGAFITLI